MSLNSTETLADIRHFVSESEYSYIQELEMRRRQRNTEILAKIQELKITASVHAARSLQFQNARDEYEGFVRKYKENKHAAALNTNLDTYGSFGAAPWKTETPQVYPFSTILNTVSAGGQLQEKVFASIGCNTDITGPIKALTPEPEPANLIQKLNPVPVSLETLIVEPQPLQSAINDNHSKIAANKFFDIPAAEDSESTTVNESGHLEADLAAAIKAINNVFEEADNSLSMSISTQQQQSLNQSSMATDPDESMSLQSSSYAFERKPSLKTKSKSKKAARKMRKQSLRRSDSSLANASAIGNDDSKVESSKFKNVDSFSESGNTSQIIDVPEEKQAPAEADEISKDDESKSEALLAEDKTDTSDSNPSIRSAGLTGMVTGTTEEKRRESVIPSAMEQISNAESEDEIVERSSLAAEDDDIDSDKDGESEKAQTKSAAALASPHPPEKVDKSDSTGKSAAIARNKFRVKLGYSDSEGSSDISEIGGTVPISIQPTAAHSAQHAAGSSAFVPFFPKDNPPPKADLDDDFFDF